VSPDPIVFSLASERLLLRSFQDSDLGPFLAYRNDPLVARYQSWALPYTREQGIAFIDEMKRATPGIPGEWYQIALELKATGEMIGDCVFFLLREDPRQAEIGYTLARSHQGRGYASEAICRLLDYLFGELCLHRVRANCDADNLASSRLLERVGMRREAHFVENFWFKGRWTSEYWYAILRREWLEMGDGGWE
jgi:RimJ/RimL family protein N-acetyltransferase